MDQKGLGDAALILYFLEINCHIPVPTGDLSQNKEIKARPLSRFFVTGLRGF
jgi:hypothetical protein